MSQLLDRYPYFKQYLLPLGIGLIGFVLIIIGVIASFTPKKEDITFQNTQPVGNGLQPFQPTGYQTAPGKQIMVDIEGSVQKPGVYHLPADARVQDALITSGGLAGNADRDFVQKKINLAAKLIDGAKLYIPHTGEQISNSGLQTQAGQQTSLSTTDQSLTININEASSDQLDALQGIGQVTAQKIINGRPYSDVQELLTRKIVSTKVFNEIKDKITVN